ncbi:MAG: asparagine synthase-related protein [Pseudomonadota bacterium]
MTVFVGIVRPGFDEKTPNAAEALLSYVDAPHQNELELLSDRDINLAAKHNGTEHGVFKNDQLFVVACGRLDDSANLCDQLRVSHSTWNVATLIAAAYMKWGEALTEHIFGEFSFAVWNRNDRSLFCGRDRFGQIPFAYMVTDDGIVFSTDFIAIAMAQSEPPKLDDAWIVGYISQTVLDAESSPFENVKKLPPACTLTWRAGALSIRAYWSFENIGPTFCNTIISDLSTDLEHAVQKRLVRTNVATMLSGGLDSSAIAVLARDLHRRASGARGLSSFSLIFERFPGNDERPFIESVLEQGGFEPHFVNTHEYNAVSAIDRLVRIQGGPVSGMGAPILDQAIAKAEQLGFTSLLDGHGGDEVISGYGNMRLFELADKGEWLKLLRETRRLSQHSDLGFVSGFASLYGTKGRGVFAKLIHKLFWKWRISNETPASPSLLHADWQQHAAISSAEKIANSWYGASHKSERSYQEYILTAPLQAAAFERLHRLYRSRGVRPEFPFWDQKVVEYCVRVPSHEKLKNGVPRSLIRSAMQGRLPPMISGRTTKFDFADAHIQSFQSSAEQVQDCASDPNHPAFDYVDRDVFVSTVSGLHDDRIQVRKDAHRKAWTALNIILSLDMIERYQSQKKAL